MRLLYQLAFRVLVAVHIIIIIAVIASFFVLPCLEPWYVALPLDIFILHLLTQRVDCPLTNMENALRKKLGMRKIGGFFGHYFLRPFRRRRNILLTEHKEML